MTDIIALSPLSGLGLPRSVGSVEIGEVRLGSVTSVMPFKRRVSEVSRVLEASLGLPLTDVGHWHKSKDGRILWAGLDLWMVEGDKAIPDVPAGITDQSDAWASLSLTGDAAAAVMARLVPIDLASLKPGQVARTEFVHMASIIIRNDDGFEVWVMRSFARTALHDMETAASSVIAIRTLRSET